MAAAPWMCAAWWCPSSNTPCLPAGVPCPWPPPHTNTHHQGALSEEEGGPQLDRLLARLPALATASTSGSSGIDEGAALVLKALGSWPGGRLFPVLDLARLLALDAAGAAALAAAAGPVGATGGWWWTFSHGWQGH